MTCSIEAQERERTVQEALCFFEHCVSGLRSRCANLSGMLWVRLRRKYIKRYKTLVGNISQCCSRYYWRYWSYDASSRSWKILDCSESVRGDLLWKLQWISLSFDSIQPFLVFLDRMQGCHHSFDQARLRALCFLLIMSKLDNRCSSSFLKLYSYFDLRIMRWSMSKWAPISTAVAPRSSFVESALDVMRFLILRAFTSIAWFPNIESRDPFESLRLPR